MDLHEYQQKARSTAVYLEVESNKIIYPALGLVGECGEVAEKAKKLIRDANGKMTPERSAAIAKELGDCCWYVANICCDLGLDPKTIYGRYDPALRQLAGRLDLPRLVLRLSRHAATVSSMLEQLYYWYDGNIRELGNFPEIDLDLCHVLVHIEEIGRRCGFTLEEIYTANIEKLASRNQSGTLHGDGDNR